jgi:DNA-binding SARP family transcriptional activator
LRAGDKALTEPNLSCRDPVRLTQYLTLAPGRRAHREQVIDALWPEAPFETAANRLHKEAHNVRKATAMWCTRYSFFNNSKYGPSVVAGMPVHPG